MAWTNLENLGSGLSSHDFHVNTSSRIYYTNGSDAYYYDVDLDTITQIGNSNSLTTGNSWFGDNLRYFKGNVYAADNDAGGGIPKVYRWSGSGTSWNEVLAMPTATYGYLGYTSWSLSAGKDVMTFVVPDGSGGCGAAISYLLPVRYTADGSSWNNGTVQDDDITHPTLGGFSSNIPVFSVLNWGNKVPDNLYIRYLMQCGITDDNNLYKLLKWNSSNARYETVDYRKKVSGVLTGSEWVKDYICQDNANWADGTSTSSEYHYDAEPLAGSFIAPASQDFIMPSTPTSVTIPSQGFPSSYLTVGYKKTSLGGGNNRVDMVLINDDGTLEAAEEITSSGNRTPHAFFRFTDTGNVYALLLSGTNYEVWGRDTPLDPPPVGEDRLWIYKTTDRGITWSSRGIKTA